MMGRRKSFYVIVPGDGDACQTCGQPTQIREHPEITEKHLAQPFYYTRWFNCTNPACKTTIQHRERYRVWRAAGYKKPKMADGIAQLRAEVQELRAEVEKLRALAQGEGPPPWE